MENRVLKEDHCSLSPDSILGYDISSACATHDYYYELNETMPYGFRKEADIRLRKDINAILPFWLHWAGWIYYFFVRIFGKIYEK